MEKKVEELITYPHHGVNVWVRKELMGKHRQHCLCHICSKFNPEDREKNCPIANLLFSVCVLCNLTTPVWECPEFDDMKKIIKEI